MKNKSIAIALFVSLMICCVLCLTACDELLQGLGHTHTYSASWTIDTESHWRTATCEHADKVSDKAEHNFGEDNICTECGYEQGTTPHSHTFADSWNSDIDYHWHSANCEHTDVLSGKASHSYDSDNKCTVCEYQKVESELPNFHSHTFTEGWAMDTENHWHAATCEHTYEISERSRHSFGADNVCGVCGYVQGEEPHIHTFSESWTRDSSYHWHAATCEHQQEVQGKAEHTFVNNECTVCNYKQTASYEVDSAVWQRALSSVVNADNFKLLPEMQGLTVLYERAGNVIHSFDVVQISQEVQGSQGAQGNLGDTDIKDGISSRTTTTYLVESYLQLDGDTAWLYKKYNGIWAKTANPRSMFDQTVDEGKSYLALVSAFQDKYDLMKYDAEQQMYTLSIPSVSVSVAVYQDISLYQCFFCVKFIDGAIEEVIFTAYTTDPAVDANAIRVSFALNNVGSTKITLPNADIYQDPSDEKCQHQFEYKSIDENMHFGWCIKCGNGIEELHTIVDGACAKCDWGNSSSADHKHDYSIVQQFDDSFHQLICKYCKKSIYIEHDFVDRVCSVCGYETTSTEPKPEPHHHNYVYQYVDEQTHKAVCSECGNEFTSEHFFLANLCNDCGYDKGHTHVFLSYEAVDEDTHSALCMSCMNTVIERHEFSGNRCRKCGYSLIETKPDDNNPHKVDESVWVSSFTNVVVSDFSMEMESTVDGITTTMVMHIIGSDIHTYTYVGSQGNKTLILEEYYYDVGGTIVKDVKENGVESQQVVDREEYESMRRGATDTYCFLFASLSDRYSEAEFDKTAGAYFVSLPEIEMEAQVEFDSGMLQRITFTNPAVPNERVTIYVR